MTLRLDRRFWTLLLLALSAALGFARMWVLAGGLKAGSELEGGVFFGGVLGGALLPWAAGALAAYIHWFINKTRRDREYMLKVYPGRRRAVLHGTVLIVCALMALELLTRLATTATAAS